MDEERNYCELNETIRIMKSQRIHVERNRLIGDGKIMGIDEIIKQNERTNKSFKISSINIFLLIYILLNVFTLLSMNILKQCYHILQKVKTCRKYKSKSFKIKKLVDH